MAGVKGKSGPKPGNLNALRNGSKLNANRLVVGELPGTMVSVKREGRKYRTELEAATLHEKGTIDLVDAHHIDTATAATVQAGVCRWLLRNRLETKDDEGKVVARMSISDIRGCQADIVKAKQQRDRAVEALHLDVESAPWETAFNGDIQDEDEDEDEINVENEIIAEVSDGTSET